MRKEEVEKAGKRIRTLPQAHEVALIGKNPDEARSQSPDQARASNQGRDCRAVSQRRFHGAPVQRGNPYLAVLSTLFLGWRFPKSSA